MNDCIFCKINAGIIPSPKVYEDDDFFIINDIDPKANKHYLAIPKKHYKYLADMSEEDQQTVGKILKKIANLAPSLGLEGGYRLCVNQGDDPGQTVPHLHIHVLGGQKMDFPKL